MIKTNKVLSKIKCSNAPLKESKVQKNVVEAEIHSTMDTDEQGYYASQDLNAKSRPAQKSN